MTTIWQDEWSWWSHLGEGELDAGEVYDLPQEAPFNVEQEENVTAVT